ncbi:hypothetical protein [Opitutus sp. ER46]|uniref:hypothetical protein n=1 Tax=Opitutus sp. ER46 TaxID=2161864 RepID=UPI0011B1DA58|nr:hypothetical protein [Opitutus sp. ER46]
MITTIGVGIWVIAVARGERLQVALLFAGIVAIMGGYLRRILIAADVIGGFAPKRDRKIK